MKHLKGVATAILLSASIAGTESADIGKAFENAGIKESIENEMVIVPIAPKKPVKIPAKYVDMVNEIASKYGFEPNFIAGVIQTESKWKPHVVSRAKCKGLMQIADETANEMAKKLGWKNYNIFDPRTNIELGTLYLKTLAKLDYVAGDQKKLLATYNWGMGNFKRKVADKGIDLDTAIQNKILPKETRDYIEKILGDKT